MAAGLLKEFLSEKQLDSALIISWKYSAENKTIFTLIYLHNLFVITDLAFEENSMGRFLKDFGKLDKTRAGKIMIASGKAVSYSSQQRLALRPSIIRLAEEVDTFYFRAIDDTSQTVSGMEKVRTEYRLFLIRSTHYFLN